MIAHEDVLVEAPSSMGAHCKMKLAAVFDYNKYKTGVDRSDQMLSYNSFARKTIWLASAGTGIQVQGQTSSPAGRLVGRDHFYIGFQRHMLGWRENLRAHVVFVQRVASARPEKLKKFTTMNRRTFKYGLCIRQCFEVCHFV
jgi:hypothetical protein